MPPPPRPPIICYDLQTDSNARPTPCARYRVPPISAGRGKTKVTVVKREQSELLGCKTNSCCHRHSPRLRKNEQQVIYRNKRIERLDNNTHLTRDAATSRHNFRVSSGHQELKEAEPCLFNRNPFCASFFNSKNNIINLNNNNARHAYGQRLRQEAEIKERRKEEKKCQLAMQAELDSISAELESKKRLLENLRKTFGMSHNTAKYIQHQDEDIARLKRKVDQFSELRSKELGRRVQQMKRCHELQKTEDKKAEERRSSNVSKLTHSKHLLSGTLNDSLSSSSQATTNNEINTASSSSTISISSSSSPMSTHEAPPSIHFVESPLSSRQHIILPTSNRLSSSTPCKSLRSKACASKFFPEEAEEDHFSFYKRDHLEPDETLEITDINFFDKVEDRTMIEVNELYNQMQCKMKELEAELKYST